MESKICIVSVLFLLLIFSNDVKQNDILEIKLWDHDAIGSNDSLGQVEINLSDYSFEKNYDEWKSIAGKNAKGELHLGISWGKILQLLCEIFRTTTIDCTCKR